MIKGTLQKISTSKSKILKLVVYNILFAISLILAYKSLNWEEFHIDFVQINYAYLVLSLLFLFSYYILLSFGWHKIYRLYEADNEFPMFLTFLATQIYKYLPSSLFIYSFRIIYAREFGATLKKSIVAVTVEHLFIIYSGILVFLLFQQYIAIFFIIIFVSYLLLYMAKRLGDRTLKIPFIKILPLQTINFRRLTMLYILYFVGWISIGLSLFLFNLSLGNSNNLASLISFQAFSSSAGILAVFAPGGLGVREFILSFSGIGTATIIGWRIVTILVEIFVTIGGALLKNRFKEQK